MATPPPILTFTEIPADLAQLPFNHHRTPNNDAHTGASVDSPAQFTSTPHIQLTQVQQLQQKAAYPSASSRTAPLTKISPATAPFHSTRTIGLATPPENNLEGDSSISGNPTLSLTAPSSAVTPAHHPHTRRPSPGLAARLKALGFSTGTRKETSSPQVPTVSHAERFGRLPEDQIRLIDQNHQAGSQALVVERRGRPWKGASAAVARFPTSVVNLASGLGKLSSDTDNNRYPSTDVTGSQNTTAVTATQPEEQTTDSAAAPPTSSFLPEIEPSQPLEMDTNKYRLPDHTNGNGTKVQLDTRQQHIERDPSNPNPSSSSSGWIASPEFAPPPLPKDTPPLSQQQQSGASVTPSQPDFNPDATSYFSPLGLQRPGSIYTLSRVSFASQLAQLTSLQLPDAESLYSKVSAIPTAQAATRALIGAAEQIRNWISKASEVIEGLDSDDDVEWAAAGGREGLEEVENAILRFEELINVYVSAIESLQRRPDSPTVTRDELQRAVFQMESIMEEWSRMRRSLHNVKAQVEIAMEWEELWGMVLGDIQNEMDELSRLVFEMEEHRHKSLADGAGVDIGDLETIVQETQHKQQLSPSVVASRNAPSSGNRLSVPIFPLSPVSPDARSATPTISHDDSSLLALFARMQPLRASLDFLPMRLSAFETRASSCFPTACEELEMRHSGLDSTYSKLEKDAESLRKELGEDRWVTVFRGAARQAQKMYESVERSVAKLKDGLDAGQHLTNHAVITKKIESYETKKMHYGPAIDRVLAIIDKGVKDRLTLNGEILRLHVELQAQWDELRDRMHDLDLALEEMHTDEFRNQQLRDSVSSMLSYDRSTIGSSHDTPLSSPPSSVIMSTLGLDNGSNKHLLASNTDKGTPTNNRRRSILGSHLPQPASHRSLSSSVMQGASQARRSLSRFSSSFGSGSSPSRDSSVTPIGRRLSTQSQHVPSSLESRPRWNTSTTGIDTGHNFKPLSLTTPSPYVKTPPSAHRPAIGGTPRSASSLGTRLPVRSPLGRGATASTAPDDSPASSDPLGFRDAPHYRSPQPASPMTAPSTTDRRASFHPPRANEGFSPNAAPLRPASSMATSRRGSFLPAPLNRDSSVSGRSSPLAGSAARLPVRKVPADQKTADNRPKWRY